MSANAYDSIADYYVVQKEYDKALLNLSKAYEISSDDYFNQRMDELKEIQEDVKE